VVGNGEEGTRIRSRELRFKKAEKYSNDGHELVFEDWIHDPLK